MDSIENMNSDPNWRKIIGKPKLDPRLRDAELILRVIALAHNWRNYEKPMKMFLNQFLSGRKRMNSDAISDVIERENSNFIQLCEKIYLSAGEKPFHLRGRLNYAFLDSFMAVTFAHAEVDANALGRALEDLKGDEEYVRLCTYNTSDESVLKARFEKSELAVTNATRQN